MNSDSGKPRIDQSTSDKSGLDAITILQICGGILCAVLLVWFIAHSILKII